MGLAGYDTVAGQAWVGGDGAKGPRSVLIIEARFYEDIADELARGAIDELEAHHLL